MNDFKNFNIIRNLFLLPVFIILITFIMIIGTGCYENPEIEKKLAGSDGIAEQAERSTISENPGVKTLEEAIASENENNKDVTQDYSFAPSLSYPEVDGLHVTGTPVEIDIETFRLKITGLVEKELEFTFDEIKNMESEQIFAVLNCPGFFVDEGNWTGVEIIDLLNMAGLKKEAKIVRFIEEGGGYTKEVSFEKIKNNEDSYLVAYLFNGEEFPEVHGFPLRIVAKDEPGNVWVKWLGEIEVLE